MGSARNDGNGVHPSPLQNDSKERHTSQSTFAGLSWVSQPHRVLFRKKHFIFLTVVAPADIHLIRGWEWSIALYALNDGYDLSSVGQAGFVMLWPGLRSTWDIIFDRQGDVGGGGLKFISALCNRGFGVVLKVLDDALLGYGWPYNLIPGL